MENQNEKSKNALIYAFENNHIEMLEMIIDHFWSLLNEKFCYMFED